MDPWKPPTSLTEHLAEALPVLLIVMAMTAWMFVPEPSLGSSKELPSIESRLDP